MTVIFAAAEFDMPSKIWDLANYITGFVVAQALYFAVAFGTETELQKVARRQLCARLLIFMFTFLAMLVYCAAIYVCHGYLSRCQPNDAAMLQEVAYARYGIIVLFQLILLLAILDTFRSRRGH
jgi:hypothetical protein